MPFGTGTIEATRPALPDPAVEVLVAMALVLLTPHAAARVATLTGTSAAGTDTLY